MIVPLNAGYMLSVRITRLSVLVLLTLVPAGESSIVSDITRGLQKKMGFGYFCDLGAELLYFSVVVSKNYEQQCTAVRRSLQL